MMIVIKDHLFLLVSLSLVASPPASASTSARKYEQYGPDASLQTRMRVIDGELDCIQVSHERKKGRKFICIMTCFCVCAANASVLTITYFD